MSKLQREWGQVVGFLKTPPRRDPASAIVKATVKIIREQAQKMDAEMHPFLATLDKPVTKENARETDEVVDTLLFQTKLMKEMLFRMEKVLESIKAETTENILFR